MTFDLFGTLIRVETPDDPAEAVEAELRSRGVPIPGDWKRAYGESHVDVPAGAEVHLATHVRAALASRGIEPDGARDVVRSAVTAAFEPSVETRTGARDAVATAAERGPVGVLSNCSVDGLVRRSIDRSTLDADVFDAIVASVDSGWRKPDRRAFESAAASLDVGVDELRHVGDDPETDGGADDVGGTAILLNDVSLEGVAAGLREGRWG